MVDEGFNAKSKSSSNVKAALWETLGKAQGRLETSPSKQAESEHSTASTSDARLLPPTDSGADIPRLQNALPTITTPEETPVGESGIEIVKGKTKDRSKTASRGRKRVDNSTSARQQTHTTESDANPFLHEQVDLLVEEDLDLEGWETGHDLPTRKR